MKTIKSFSLNIIFFIFSFVTFLTVPNESTAQGFGKQTTSYKIPNTSNSGLIDIFFEYEPVFTIDEFQTASGIKLDLNIVLSTATELKGNFWYRYLYMGEQYTDEDLGRDVFVPLALENMKLKIWVTGPGSFSKTMTYQSFLGNHKILTVPGKHKPSDFKVFIQGLEGISFKGTSAIHTAINNLIADRKKKVTDQKVKVEEGLNTNKITKEKNDPNKNSADDDFWETGKKNVTTKKDVKSNNTDAAQLPAFFKTSDGKYYKKDSNDKLQEIDYDGYMKMKLNKSEEDKKNKVLQTKSKQQEDQKAVDDLMVKIRKDQDANNQIYKDIDRKFDLQKQGFAAVGAREEAKNNLKQLSTLSDSYQSVDQLMADFNQRMAQLNNSVKDLTYKKNQALNSSADAYFNTPDVAAYGTGIKLVGGMINQAKEAKEKKRAQEELRQQKDAMVNNMIIEEKRLLSGIRTDLFSKFKEGNLPLSSANISENTIYYFAYAYDPAQLGLKNPTLFLSNVFAVNKYSDGTWPFKTSITTSIYKLTPYQEVLHGFYKNKDEAMSMQKAMQDVFAKTGGLISPINYKSKSTVSSSSSNTDFWETGKKAKEASTKDKTPVKKEDFWNN